MNWARLDPRAGRGWPSGSQPRLSVLTVTVIRMRVSVLVDGYNLYYAGRKLCGRGTAGWRWLDVRGLAQALVAEQAALWPGAAVTQVVYCTARVKGVTNQSGAFDQEVYLTALRRSGSVDHIELGNYIAKVIARPLATQDNKRRPVITEPAWPVRVQQNDQPVPGARFMVSVATWEEKGSDVNVASHLLVQVLTGAADAAVVISNDSDLRWPVQETRRRVPVGMVNPGSGFLAGDLTGSPTDGAGRHWWRTLRAADFRAHQLPDPAGGKHRPPDW